MTIGAPIMSSQKIGPSSLASRARSCAGAVESSDSMLPTTGLVGGCGIGASRFFDAILAKPLPPPLDQLGADLFRLFLLRPVPAAANQVFLQIRDELLHAVG